MKQEDLTTKDTKSTKNSRRKRSRLERLAQRVAIATGRDPGNVKDCLLRVARNQDPDQVAEFEKYGGYAL